jgi:hypothetical protein
MSRSCYSEDLDQWQAIMWRGAVVSAIRGKRGQEFLREMLSALDALPAPRLISGELQKDGEVCALGSVGAKRGMNLAEIYPEDYETVAKQFGIAEALAREIAYENDEGHWKETPEERFSRVRAWVVAHLAPTQETP